MRRMTWLVLCTLVYVQDDVAGIIYSALCGGLFPISPAAAAADLPSPPAVVIRVRLIPVLLPARFDTASQGLADSARHLTGCHLTRHRMPFNSSQDAI